MNSIGASHNAAERELYRYFQPPDDDLFSPTIYDTPGRPRPSPDASLTAFAQLGALRLDAKRGFTLLITHDTEYIVAEAGQTLSLQEESRHEKDDGLWYGVMTLKGGLTLSAVMMRKLRLDPKSGDPVFFFPDLGADEDFRHLPIVIGPPFAQSLLAVPIRTSSNIIIGFYGVCDDKKGRLPPNKQQVQFLLDMAATVMDHLEVGRIQRQNERSQSMVKALGLFIEGQCRSVFPISKSVSMKLITSSIREWWTAQETQRRRSIRSSAKTSLFLSVEEQADHRFGTQDTSTKSLLGLGLNHAHDNRGSMFTSNAESSPATPGSSITGDPDNEQGISTTPSDAKALGFFDRPLMSANEGTSFCPTSYTAPTPATEDPPFEYTRSMSLHPLEFTVNTPTTGDLEEVESGRNCQEDLLSTKLKVVFSRGANLIRESVQLDGAVFFDAKISSFAGSAKEKGDEQAPGTFVVHNTSEGPTSGSEEEPRRSGEEERSFAEQIAKRNEEACMGKRCNVLGFSTRQKSTVNNHLPPDELLNLPEKFLRSLLKKYPHGKVYNFSADGLMCSSESDGNQSSTAEPDRKSTRKNSHLQNPVSGKRKTMSRETESETILKVFPGARSAVFYPLWDNGRERWFSGSFMWSTSATRVLDPLEDLTYIVSFGNSIMSEVSRISAVLSSQMKSDFVSSISHELRSPLHGILASVELIQESSMTDMQADMVSTINSCGKTLLDTINHVLDFSKVNRRQKYRSVKKRSKRAPKSKGSSVGTVESAREEDMEDISVVSEEVIESVYAGSSLGKPAYRKSHGGYKFVVHRPGGDSTPPMVIVEIKWRPNWRFEVDGGAWRRILMNLFGNSMKYTKAGFVRVVLEIKDEATCTDGESLQGKVCLTITDSGKGMSEEFLKTHLYTAFVQEDSLEAGTGLGLNIVRHIVQDLGGTLNFTSEKGVGTEASLVLPVKSALRKVTDELEANVVLSEVRDKTKTLRACIVGFDAYPNIIETPTGILSPANQAKLYAKSAISSMLEEWFEMKISSSPSFDLEAADMHVVAEEYIVTSPEFWNAIEFYRKKPRRKGNVKIVLIFCVTYTRNPTVVDEDGFRVFYVPQPHGPHRIAASIHHTLCQQVANSGIYSPTLTTAQPKMTRFAQLPQTVTMVERPRNVSGEKVRPPMVRSSNWNAKAEMPQAAGGLKILLVDDNAINLKKLLVTFMRKLGHEHASAVNGLEALKLYQSTGGSFDCILMDISMPVMDGLTSSRKIRQHGLENKLRDPAIIALTGAASMSARQEAFASGIDLFLTKPVPLKKLKMLLEDLRESGREALIEAR